MSGDEVGILASALSAGGAALAGLSAPVWGGIALLASVPLLLSAYNGIQEEFNTDLKDLKDEVVDLLSENPTALENRLLSEMISMIDSIRSQKDVLDAGGDDFKSLGKAIASIAQILRDLRAKVNEFSASSGSWLPDIISNFLSSVRDRMSNLEESWQKFMETVGSQAKAQAAEASANVGKSGAPGATPNGMSSNEGSAQKERDSAGINDTERISGMQKFLLRVPASFWGSAGFTRASELEETGFLDQATREALESFAEHVSTKLGAQELNGSRLAREGSYDRLYQLWDFYNNSWKYFKY